MTVRDLYSYRKRLAVGDSPDIYSYDELPNELRVQIVHIWRESVGTNNAGEWKAIHDAIAREHGRFSLAEGGDCRERCESFLLNNTSVDAVLDLIELCFRSVVRRTGKPVSLDSLARGITVTADKAIDELNERFRRASVGYRFESGMIVRVDSELIHSEVVRPALQFLHQPGFDGPREEFLRAHSHYRAGRTKEAVTTANSAFESTLKAICDQKRWEYDSGATGPRLVKLVRANGLLPDYLENPFEQLVGVLKSGLSGVRNNVASHGQGSTPRETPEYVAAFALHLAAAKILFLVEALTATT